MATNDAAQPAALPKKRRAGAVIAAIGVLLLAGLAVGAAIAVDAGLVPNPGDLLASPAHQKVAVAGRLFEAIATADPVKLRGVMPADAASAADPAWWIEKLSGSGGYGSIVSEAWSGDTLTIVMHPKDGSGDQQAVLSATGVDKVRVATSDIGHVPDPKNAGVLRMVKEGVSWKILAVLGADGTEFIRFDAPSVKARQNGH
jgi:hypothetical protein